MSIRTRALGTLALLGALLALLLAACAPSATPASTATPGPTLTATATPTPPPTASPTPTPLTLVDSAGRTVILQAPPRRIIAYDGDAVETIYALGAGDRLVGTHSFVTYPPEAADVTKVGDAFSVNLELAASLEPDLFYIFYDRFTPDLQALGIRVLYLESPTTLQGAVERIRLWGRILERRDAAEALARRVEERIAENIARLDDVPQGPRVLYEVGDLWVAGPDTFIGDMLATLGAVNVAADVEGFAQLSAEQVVALDPQVVIAPYQGAAQVYAQHPALGGISAVREGRVHEVDATLFSSTGPRVGDALDTLAALLYPDRSP